MSGEIGKHLKNTALVDFQPERFKTPTRARALDGWVILIRLCYFYKSKYWNIVNVFSLRIVHLTSASITIHCSKCM